TFLYPFIMGARNGWASLVPMLSLYLWIYLHGLGSQSRLISKNWWNNPIGIQCGYSVSRFLLYSLLFQPLIQLNPPFWNVNAVTSISSSLVAIFLVRGLIMEWLLLAVAFVCLHLPLVKHMLGIPVKENERYNGRVFVSIVGLGLFFMISFMQLQASLFHDDPMPLFFLQFTTEIRFFLFFSGFLFIMMSGVTIHFLERHLESESRLFKTALRYQSLFEAMDDLYFECDSKGTIVHVSPSVYGTLNCRPNDILGQSFFQTIGREKEQSDWLKATARSQTIKDDAIEIETQDGDRRYWSMHLKQVTLSDSDSRLVSVIRDFTDYQYALNHIKLLNQTLEDKVVDRTATLNATLEALERFVYVVSHDLKTPARAMSAYADILIEDEADTLCADSMSYLKQVQEISDEMIHFIESLLSYAMLGNKKPDAQRFNPTDIIKTVANRLQLAYPETNCSLHFNGDLTDLYADRILFQQLLTNVLENAFKYKEPRRPLTLTFSDGSSGGGSLTIEDNGLGINPEDKRILFDLFQAGQKDATGIGLATVKKIMDMHGGKVWLDGELGKGTRLTVEFPHPVELQRKEVT
ncbi:MAG: PAS domain-containing sensor histidine kinase, partial [Alkalibacterium sp.]|nr:PAS domain-containing sensor histidine kinase [Alkalibacterium sp.]